MHLIQILPIVQKQPLFLVKHLLRWHFCLQQYQHMLCMMHADKLKKANLPTQA